MPKSNTNPYPVPPSARKTYWKNWRIREIEKKTREGGHCGLGSPVDIRVRGWGYHWEEGGLSGAIGYQQVAKKPRWVRRNQYPRQWKYGNEDIIPRAKPELRLRKTQGYPWPKVYSVRQDDSWHRINSMMQELWFSKRIWGIILSNRFTEMQASRWSGEEQSNGNSSSGLIRRNLEQSLANERFLRVQPMSEWHFPQKPEKHDACSHWSTTNWESCCGNLASPLSKEPMVANRM